MPDTPRTLFDLVPPTPAPTLPYQGVTPEAVHCGRRAAESASKRRGKLQHRYVDALLTHLDAALGKEA